METWVVVNIQDRCISLPTFERIALFRQRESIEKQLLKKNFLVWLCTAWYPCSRWCEKIFFSLLVFLQILRTTFWTFRAWVCWEGKLLFQPRRKLICSCELTIGTVISLSALFYLKLGLVGTKVYRLVENTLVKRFDVFEKNCCWCSN